MNELSPKAYLPELKDYSLTFSPGGEKISLSAAIPAGICPFLLHSCLPYIFTLESGGSFPWMELENNKYSVRVQCPNPGGGVECLVYKENSHLFIRITSVRGQCLFGQKVNDSVSGSSRDIKVPLEVYDACFAWLVYFNSKQDGRAYSSPLIAVQNGDNKSTFLLRKDIPGSGEYSPFSRPCPDIQAAPDVALRLSGCAYRCRYFKWPRRDNFARDNFVPAGLCPELFHLSHLYAMRGIYSAKGRDIQYFSCPDPACGLKIGLRIKKTRTYALRRLAVFLFRLFRKNTEVPLYICELFIAESSAACPMNLKKGSRFIYNMGRKYELCPAAFDNIHFVLHNLSRGGGFPWGNGENSFCCPDPESNVCFSCRSGRGIDGCRDR